MVATVESLGPAERIIQTLLTHQDHIMHNRPGWTKPTPSALVGVTWDQALCKEENGVKNVYSVKKIGKKQITTLLGHLVDGGIFSAAGTKVGEFKEPGLFPEMAAWMYKQVAEVWKMDNEFAARWASYAFPQEHRDMKVVLAAFMLCQSRCGKPVMDGGVVAFHDDDYRSVGEAMLLLRRTDKRGFDPKLIARVYDLLSLPQVAQINRDLGFSKSARNPYYGRYKTAVEIYLRHLEDNPKLLEGQVKAGWRKTVMRLARIVHFKPQSARFFEILRWKQKQSKIGCRTVAIGAEVAPAETWEGLTEEQICERIAKDKPNYKRIVGLVPKSVGVTRAIMAAAIEYGCLSNKDLIIYTPTLEELGLLEVQDIKERWQKANREAEDTRAANIATRVKSKELQEELQGGADNALKKAVAEEMKQLRVYFMVDRSGSMEGAIEEAKGLLKKFLQSFPADKVHISYFNTIGREVTLKQHSAAGVEQAFVGVNANGGTDYGAGVKVLQNHKPALDEDTIFIFVGDEEAPVFTHAVQQSGLRPSAFGFLKVRAVGGAAGWRAGMYETSGVRDTAAALGIPCFMIDKDTFNDPYAVPRTIRNLVASTPVGTVTGRLVPQRETLIEQILKTELLKPPVWAS